MAMSQKKLPKFLDDWEREALLNMPNKRYWTGERNKLLIRLMLKTGLRLSEVISLQWDHVNLLTGRLMVREGKGSKDRTLWIDDKTITQLRDWRDRQTERTGIQDVVFTTLQGKALHPRYIQQMLERYSEKAGIRHVHPHLLRHSFAVEFLEQGGNIRSLQMLLGHSDLSTTQVYLQLSNKHLEEDLRQIQGRW
jgi:integrase/recombinase XerD